MLPSADVTALRITGYPDRLELDHASLHAASCASVMGSLQQIWAGRSQSAGKPYVAVKFHAALAASKLRAQVLPFVRGTALHVLPWEGAITADTLQHSEGPIPPSLTHVAPSLIRLMGLHAKFKE